MLTRVFLLAAALSLAGVALAACGSLSAAGPVTPVLSTDTPGAVLVVPTSTETQTAGIPTATVVDTPTDVATSTPVAPTPTPLKVASATPTRAGPQATATIAPPKSTATPASIPPNGPLTVTLADAGATINLKVGDSFLLALGEIWQWTVTVDDPSIVSRQVNILVVRGAQGVYNAHKPGQTMLRATGDPLCRQVNPPCALPSRLFQVKLVVHP